MCCRLFRWTAPTGTEEEAGKFTPEFAPTRGKLVQTETTVDKTRRGEHHTGQASGIAVSGCADKGKYPLTTAVNGCPQVGATGLEPIRVGCPNLFSLRHFRQ